MVELRELEPATTLLKEEPSDPEGLRGIMQYLEIGYYPVPAPTELFVNWRGKLPVSLWPEAATLHQTRSLRELAKKYGVSHETIRRTLAVIRPQTKLAET